MRTTFAASLLLLSVAAAGCGADPSSSPATGTVDCQQGVRYDGETYVEVGYLDAEGATSLGKAEVGECDDQGADPTGLTFPGDTGTVEVWQVDGVDAQQAVGHRTDDGLQVFVAASLGQTERDQLVESLGLD